MTPQQLNAFATTPALSLLPPRMDTREARVLLLAIALQESALKYRQQVLKHGRSWWEWRGPARGWLQFETTGLKGVLTHHASKDLAQHVLRELGYDSPGPLMPLWLTSLHEAFKHNDVLCLAMGRLLLWTLPQALATEVKGAQAQYLNAWRPGAWFKGTQEDKAELTRKWYRNWVVAQEAIA